jgi:hypothetical protein
MATFSQPKYVFKDVPHNLTAAEKNVIGDKISKILDDLDTLEDDRQASAAKFKSREKDLKAKLKETRKARSDGFEIRTRKCEEVMDRQARKVNYVDTETGDVVQSRDFTNEDWKAVFDLSQLGLFTDEDTEGLDEDEIRARAEAAVQPDKDAQGNVVAGENTDKYNMLHMDSPYQSLSSFIDFAPAITSVQAADAAAESPTGEPETTTPPEGDDSAPEGDDEPTPDDEPQPDAPTTPPAAPAADDEAGTPAKRKARRTGTPPTE